MEKDLSVFKKIADPYFSKTIYYGLLTPTVTASSADVSLDMQGMCYFSFGYFYYNSL